MKENSEKVDMYDFPVHDYTQEQNGSPYSISTFDSANGLSRKIVVIQKFCYHGNLTSHFCSLFAKQQICMCSTLFLYISLLLFCMTMWHLTAAVRKMRNACGHQCKLPSRRLEVTGARKNREHAVFFLVPITSKQATLVSTSMACIAGAERGRGLGGKGRGIAAYH